MPLTVSLKVDAVEKLFRRGLIPKTLLSSRAASKGSCMQQASSKLIVSPKQVYEIDGAGFASLEGFFDEISKKLIPNAKWGRNLDAFNVY